MLRTTAVIRAKPADPWETASNNIWMMLATKELAISQHPHVRRAAPVSDPGQLALAGLMQCKDSGLMRGSTTPEDDT